jgi:hypothetical protein
VERETTDEACGNEAECVGKLGMMNDERWLRIQGSRALNGIHRSSLTLINHRSGFHLFADVDRVGELYAAVVQASA